MMVWPIVLLERTGMNTMPVLARYPSWPLMLGGIHYFPCHEVD